MGGDKNDRISITGFVSTVGGALVNYRSKKQNAIALSSAEAELYAGSLVYQDGLFIDSILKEILPNEVVQPMYVHVDNSGAVFIMSNDSVSDRTKHIE